MLLSNPERYEDTNWEIICIVLFEELEKFLMQLAEILENE